MVVIDCQRAGPSTGVPTKTEQGDLWQMLGAGHGDYPRAIALADAIELGKQRRPFLKQARANVLNQRQQLRAATGQWLPTITTTGGGTLRARSIKPWTLMSSLTIAAMP